MANSKEICRKILYSYFLFFLITIGPYFFVNAGKNRVSRPNPRQNYHRQEQNQQKLIETKKYGKPKKPNPVLTIEEEINRSRIPKVRKNEIFFDPIILNCPTTSPRIGKDAEMYREKILKPFGSRALDKNLIMTGESCACGRGSVYIVLVLIEIVIFCCN